MMSEKIAKLLEEQPELRQYLEEQRRAEHAKAAASDRLLGHDGRVCCPHCGTSFDPKRARAKKGQGDN